MSSPLSHASLDLPRLRETIERAQAASQRDAKSPIVVVHLEIDAFDPVGAFGQMKGPKRFFWFQPDRAKALVAEGVTLCLETTGEGRIRDAGALLAEEEARFFYVDPESRERLRWLGGFSFDARHRSQGEWAGFPAGQLSLPSLLLESSPEGTAIVLTQSVPTDAETDSILSAFESQVIRAQSLIMERGGEEDFDRSPSQPAQAGGSGPEYAVAADRPHSVYCETVKEGVDAIVAGAFEKVVVARSLEVRHPGRYPLDGFLRRLSVIYPSCTVFAWGHEDSTLVAASPEFLVSLEGERVRTHALAGSAARGSSPDQDALFARRLLESKKEQVEHAAVVRAVREALRDVCGELEGPEAPSLLKIEGIQHLSTPLQGRLRDQDSVDSVLDLVARLHPTPAVCGFPWRQSLDWLHAHEYLERGWYAGPVGWVSVDGDGEFWLALRAGLIRQPQGDSPEGVARARLYAGAGVVEGSSPEAELVETRLKLRALLAPLTEI